MGNFWLTFAIEEAISVAQSFLNNSSIKPGVKTALDNFVQAGQALILAIRAGV